MMGTALFKNDETLRRICAKAEASGDPILLVKDQGLYFMTQSLRTEDGSKAICAYAEGCNPETDTFDEWWDRSHQIAGGDDFGEEFSTTDIARMIRSGCDLKVAFSESHITMSLA